MKVVNLVFLKIKIFKKKSTRCSLKIHVADIYWYSKNQTTVPLSILKSLKLAPRLQQNCFDEKIKVWQLAL